MLTDEQLADGWIEHDGGPCPVALDSRPTVMFRNGWVQLTTRSAGRECWRFCETDHNLDIIAYKPETPT